MIGKKPLEIPEGTTLKIEKEGDSGRPTVVKASGPKGELTVEVFPGVKVVLGDGIISLEKNKDTPQRIFGLSFALLRNVVEGVSRGFIKELELVGVGYRVTKTGDGLKMTLGFSHPVEFKLSERVSAEVEGDTKIKITGIDKQLVSQTAAEIRKLKPPEPYKGKGIRYKDEVVRLKPGKAAKTVQGATA